jgi:hypothetical protein
MGTLLKTLILKAEGGFSWTKFFYWVTTICGIVTMLPGEMSQLGLTVTPKVQHLVVIAGMVSFLIAGIRNRNASSPDAPATPAAPVAPAVPVAPVSTTEAPKAK